MDVNERFDVAHGGTLIIVGDRSLRRRDAGYRAVPEGLTELLFHGRLIGLSLQAPVQLRLGIGIHCRLTNNRLN